MSLLDWLFPRCCVGCGREGGYFCAECLNKVVLAKETIFQKDATLEGLTSVFAYQGLMKKAIKKLKYRFVSDMVGDLTELFLSFVGEDKAFIHYCAKRPILVPIPLHQKRLNWRGFNQSEVLGKRIAQNLDLPFIPNLLLRIKETQPQAELTKKERLKNIHNVFALNSQFAIRNWKIILFDDVWTSGATMYEAARVLKRAGATSVWALTLAR